MSGAVDIPAIIEKKRDGRELSPEEIEAFVSAVGSGRVEPAQLGAWLMAVYLRGMTLPETTVLTRCMMESGDTLQWPEEWRGSVCDKHSTGGVGDKVSLPLAPALAACGLRVPMISGRGLGHTGGTLDKLEAVPDFKVSMETEAMKRVIEEVGCVIVGQTQALVPADKVMYATRDVTRTVGSLPLIAGSIVSKKAAENVEALVLDVKVGRAALLPDDEAERLAEMMVGIGKGLGIKTAAVLTRMDRPIGRMVGNALEVYEAVQCLKGKGPADLRELVTQLGGVLLSRMGKAESIKEGAVIIGQKLDDGSALNKFRDMLIGQGVKEDVAKKLCNDPDDGVLPRAQYRTQLRCGKSGFVADVDGMACAVVSGSLGAGRKTKEDQINYEVGLELLVERGQEVLEGQAWVTVHHCVEAVDQKLLDQLDSAIEIQADQLASESRVVKVIE